VAAVVAAVMVRATETVSAKELEMNMGVGRRAAMATVKVATAKTTAAMTAATAKMGKLFWLMVLLAGAWAVAPAMAQTAAQDLADEAVNERDCVTARFALAAPDFHCDDDLARAGARITALETGSGFSVFGLSSPAGTAKPLAARGAPDGAATAPASNSAAPSASPPSLIQAVPATAAAAAAPVVATAADGAAGGVTGAATSAPRPDSAAPRAPVELSEAAPPSPSPPPDLDPDSLAREYRRTGTAPTVEVTGHGGGAVALVAFGHGRPVLRCAPLRACAVELEPGELVLATSLGDAERWLVQAAAAGPGARTPLLVVKPTACDLSTNLVISTDRRVYELALDSPPCHNADGGDAGYNPHLPYTGLIRFYYPDELVRRWRDDERLAREAEAERAAGRVPLAAGARLARLNFDYSWDRARQLPWAPAQVFDDGEHTYLMLGPAAAVAELPVLMAVEAGGALALVGYHLDGRTMIADRVLERAVLIVGGGEGAGGRRKGKDQERLDIVNRSFGRRAAEAGR
jgi:P-type conjugative transfer protein TrbG